MTGFLEVLDAEIQGLQRSLETDPRFTKLRELRRIRELYASDSPHPPIRVTPTSDARKSAGRKMWPETEHTIKEAEQLLANAAEPVPLRDIFRHVTQRGCKIGGRDPLNNFSAMLSRSGKFAARGKAGWMLATTRASDSDDEHPKLEAPNSSELFGAPKPTARCR